MGAGGAVSGLACLDTPAPFGQCGGMLLVALGYGPVVPGQRRLMLRLRLACGLGARIFGRATLILRSLGECGVEFGGAFPLGDLGRHRVNRDRGGCIHIRRFYGGLRGGFGRGGGRLRLRRRGGRPRGKAGWQVDGANASLLRSEG
ncbi:hypothetical protein D3876_04815 [Sphingomonas cavernae]|uniref:Uncharacterized protein n=1 Tax=Sphingomonas cavernae TaxID=2320861 RepID=A0A418WQU5_9SPHN|nr:hypothetical protein D3876_04815 [Sphingomonas cavernae]